MVEDSQSEGSVLSDLDEDADADADASDVTDTDTADLNGAQKRSMDTGAKTRLHPQKKRRNERTKGAEVASVSGAPVTFQTSADTEVMMGGLRIAGGSGQEGVVDFEELGEDDPMVKPATIPSEEQQAPQSKTETPMDRRRREHEDYKKKRESDPTFIPNRGNFFMHDPRAPDQRGFTSYGRGRGRGRGFIGGPFAPSGYVLQSTI